MPDQTLQCPFCDKTSSAPQGMSAHIRNNHQKQYSKWTKDPNRFQVVQAKSQEHPKSVERQVSKAEPPTAVAEPLQAPVPHLSGANGDGALQLLNQARQQLVDRKGVIELQLAQMEHLQTELGRVKAQIESLDSTLGVFKTS